MVRLFIKVLKDLEHLCFAFRIDFSRNQLLQYLVLELQLFQLVIDLFFKLLNRRFNLLCFFAFHFMELIFEQFNLIFQYGLCLSGFY